jgi:hypothetical protein
VVHRHSEESGAVLVDEVGKGVLITASDRHESLVVVGGTPRAFSRSH